MDSGDLGDGERAELERLRREVKNLPARATASDSVAGHNGTRLRSTVAVALIVLASLLAPVAVIARYVRAEVLDTDRYVATVAPLARDAAVQAVVTDQLTEQVFTRLDVEGTLDAALQELAVLGAPDAVTGLAPALAEQTEAFVRESVGRLVATDEFADLWVRAHRTAHDRLSALLTGRATGPLDVEDGRLTVDLAGVVERVRQRLLDRGFSLAERIPDVEYELTVLEADGLSRAQRMVRWLDRTALLLPFVCLELVAVAVYLAPGRRRALLTAAAGISLAMLVLAATLTGLRAWYLDDGAPQLMTAEAAAGIARTLLAPLRTAMRAVFAAGIVTMAAVFLTGPSPTARKVRACVSGTTRALRSRAGREGRPTAPEIWLGTYKNPLRMAIVGAGIVALVLWDYPSGAVVLAIALLVLAVLLLLELASHDGPVPPTRPDPGPPPGATRRL